MKKYLWLFIVYFFSFPAVAGDKELLQQVFQTFNDNYIDDVSLSEIVVPGLKALTKKDPYIKIAVGKKAASVFYRGKLQRVYARPEDEKDASRWADFVITVLEGAEKISPDLHRQDFELVEVLLYEGIKSFDKNSRYYPILEIGQEFVKPQPYFAALHDNNILYLRLGTINEQMIKDFNETMEKYQNLQGIILDLRGNLGGYLKYALQIADMFLSDGVMIYTTGKNKGKRQIYTATEGELYAQAPMVVLVNGNTASSAEVIAMVLQEKQRALLIGSQTYGKNSVQNIFKLTNEARLALTTERFYSSHNMDVDETSGLRPDICTTKGENLDTLARPRLPNDDLFCPRTFDRPDTDIDLATNFILEKLSSSESDE